MSSKTRKQKKGLLNKVLDMRQDELYLPTTLVITGGNRTGKTYAGLTICETQDPGFSIDRVFFTPDQFLNIVEKIRTVVRTIHKQNPKARNYSFWVLGDEISQSCSARDWQSVGAHVLKLVTEAFGYLHIHMVLTEPFFDLSKSMRKRIDYMIEMLEPGIAKSYRNRPDRWGSRDWYERMKITEFSLPSKELIEAYEHRKRNVEFVSIMKNARDRLSAKKPSFKVSKLDIVRGYLTKFPDDSKLTQRKLVEKIKLFSGLKTLSQDTIRRALNERTI